MADYDLFDMVGLAFDPAETNAKQIRKKINQKKDELGSALGRESQQTKRDSIQEQINYLDAVSGRIFSDDGRKMNKAFTELAENRVKVAMTELSGVVELSVLAGSRSVTEGMIKHYRKESHLSEAHVREVFINAGFEIVSIDPLAEYPKFPTNAALIENKLKALRNTRDNNPNGADTSIAKDLYSFAAYLSNDTKNVSLYRKLDTQELRALFSDFSKKYSIRNDNLGKLCAELASLASTNAFDSEENRKAYDRYLLYQSDELQKLFSTMKKLSKSTLLSENHAERCLKIISGYFPNRKEALAIYNKEAGFDEEYYVPDRVYSIKCNCGNVSVFISESDAIAKNKCANCGQALFKKCTQCGKMVPSWSDVCPNQKCRFEFSGAIKFPRYYKLAEESLDNWDFGAARKYLANARAAAPDRKSELDGLANRIKSAEDKLRQPIEKLQKLIVEHKFCQASVELVKIKAAFPGISIGEYERQIKDAIREADREYESARNLSKPQKARVCIGIVMKCADYKPAIAFLQTTPPMPCVAINASTDNLHGSVIINWSRSNEEGVAYRLVRKEGRTGSISENDGVVLLENSDNTSFIDKGVQAGRTYTYTVYTSRMNVYSSGISKSVTLYSDVEDLKWTQQGAEIRLYWNVPTNCIGATVIRIDNNEKTQVCVSDSANGNCVDKGLAYDRKYTYRVIAKYADNGKSDGKEIHDVYIMPIVDSFTINASPAKDGSYKVTWSIKQRGINLRVLLDNRIEMNAKSEDGFVLLKLPKETFAVVDVEAQSGNGWKRSEHSITVNTYSPCEIDKKASKLEETVQLGLRNSRHYVSIQIVISEPIPQSVIGFYYFVRDSEYKRISTRESVKTSEEIRGLISKYDSTFRQAEIVQWARSEEIGSASDCQRISLDAYRERNGILYQSLANEQTAYYVSVFAIHKKAGKEVVSEPCKYRITRPLNVDILWSVKVTRKEVKLMVELLGNRPVDYLPNLLLTLRETQRSGQRFMGNNERVIMKVGGDEFETPAKRKAVVFEEPIYIDYKEVRNGIFDLQIDEDTGKDKFTTRWKEGFTGKA